MRQDLQFSGKDEVFRYEMLKERCTNLKNKQANKKQNKTKQKEQQQQQKQPKTRKAK